MEGRKSLRISHVGLRGIPGGGLTAAHVLDFAAAFGTLREAGARIVVGRDPRASSVMLREGVLAGLRATGHDVVDVGIVSTPVMQHTIRRLGAGGGVSIGASHNGVEWNALKFFGPLGTYLSTAEAGELLDIYHLKKFAFAEWRGLGGLHEDREALDAYVEDLAKAFDFVALRGLRVLVDCCSGTSAAILERLNERYGFGFILINAHQDSKAFAHEPATNEKMARLQLAPLMPLVKADAGFLFDIDSDRVALATEQGQAVSEEMVLPLLADHLLETRAGRIVLTNVSSTALTDEVAAARGGQVVRIPVGRQAVTDALASYRPEQIAIAGEGTGAVMMPQFRFVYDGIASMLAVMTMLRRRGQTLAEIVGTYPRYSILKGALPLATHRIPELLLELEERYKDGRRNTLDGLRVDWEGRWFHVRVAQTEAVVRVICEQRGGEPRRLYQELMDTVRSYTA